MALSLAMKIPIKENGKFGLYQAIYLPITISLTINRHRRIVQVCMVKHIYVSLSSVAIGLATILILSF